MPLRREIIVNWGVSYGLFDQEAIKLLKTWFVKNALCCKLLLNPWLILSLFLDIISQYFTNVQNKIINNCDIKGFSYSVIRLIKPISEL